MLASLGAAASAAPFPWIATGLFLLLVSGLLALDLGVLNREAHVIRAREAILWTAFWVVLALVFGGAVYLAYEHQWIGLGGPSAHAASGREAMLEYVTGYLIEKSLSLDNIFVIATIFAYFRVPREFEHRVLFWGIVGVVILRGGMIAGGAALMDAFDWSVYLFGGLLFLSAIKMLTLNGEGVNIESSIALRLGRTLFPVHAGYDGQRFFTRVGGVLHATPLLLVLLMVESADALFALDSIPAIFAITTDPFIVFTSNIFAVLGLRSLYFALAAIVHKFRHLKVSLAILLAFVGIKMVLSHHYKLDPVVSLAIVGGILAMGVLASLGGDRRAVARRRAGLGPGAEDPSAQPGGRPERSTLP